MSKISKIQAFFAIAFATTALAFANDIATSATETASVTPIVQEEVVNQAAETVQVSDTHTDEANGHHAETSKYAKDHDHDMTHKMMVLAIQIGIILFAARLGGMLAEKIKLPSVLGELGAGIVIGPFALGKIPLGHHFHYGLFPEWAANFAISPELYGICTIASIVLLFLAGVETDLKMFMRYSFAGSLVGIGGVVASFIFGDVLAVFLLPKIGLAQQNISRKIVRIKKN